MATRFWMLLNISLAAGVGTACASGGAKAQRTGRALAESQSTLRESLDRQYELQVELRRAQEELERAKNELRELHTQLAARLTVEAGLKAEKEAHGVCRDDLASAQKKLSTLELTRRAELAVRLDACERSFPDKELAAYNRAVADVLRSLQIRGEPRVSKGLLTRDHYVHLEVLVAGHSLWEHTLKLDSDENPVLGSVSAVADLAGISSALRSPK